MQMVLQYESAWLQFRRPVEVLMARTDAEVFHCLEKIEKDKLWAAGFVSYEAAGAFDEALKTCPPGSLPLLCFGLFRAPEKVSPPESGGVYQLGEMKPSVTRDDYTAAIASVKKYIAAGDTYQVNYTFRLNADFSGDPFAFFCDLATAQQGRYGAFVETDEFAVCSASPELFFQLKDGVMTSRPMKGTRPRGRTAAEDRAAAHELRNAVKDRAENIMIVDMIRNDIGRIADTGSVQTSGRFHIENYPTVLQMTSTVSGKTTATFSDIWRNLFPCASITGAPKTRTMEIIRDLEQSPRGVYTGAIGFVAPDGSAQFNVAIRTAVIDKTAGRAEYGIGGGIVWDSDAAAEYDEAVSKSQILTQRYPSFQCLETMLCVPGKGIFLLDRHLKRLEDSAEYFGFRFDPEIRTKLGELSVDRPTRIRLLLNKDGSYDFQCLEIPPASGPVTLAVAKTPIHSGDVFLYHKTTNRAVYEQARAVFPAAGDVLLFNERGEVTESCIANAVVELEGRKFTPPVSCGLLAGTFRDELLAAGEIEERIISLADFKKASSLWLINSVCKWRQARVLS